MRKTAREGCEEGGGEIPFAPFARYLAFVRRKIILPA